MLVIVERMVIERGKKMVSKNYEKAQKKLVEKLEKFKIEVEAEMKKHKTPPGVRLMSEEYCEFYNLWVDVTKMLRTLKGEPEPKNYRDTERLFALRDAIEEETKKSLEKNKVILG